MVRTNFNPDFCNKIGHEQTSVTVASTSAKEAGPQHLLWPRAGLRPSHGDAVRGTASKG
jgi:hypothetical protein